MVADYFTGYITFPKKHFNESLNSPEKISTNILTSRLKMMEKESLLSSSIDPKKRRW